MPAKCGIGGVGSLAGEHVVDPKLSVILVTVDRKRITRTPDNRVRIRDFDTAGRQTADQT